VRLKKGWLVWKSSWTPTLGFLHCVSWIAMQGEGSIRLPTKPPETAPSRNHSSRSSSSTTSQEPASVRGLHPLLLQKQGPHSLPPSNSAMTGSSSRPGMHRSHNKEQVQQLLLKSSTVAHYYHHSSSSSSSSSFASKQLL